MGIDDDRTDGFEYGQRLVLTLLQSMDAHLREIRDKLDTKVNVGAFDDLEHRVRWLEKEAVSDRAAGEARQADFEKSTAAWTRRDRIGAAVIAVVLVILNAFQLSHHLI